MSRNAPPEIRFWRMVDKTETCWLWKGPINNWGYGQFRIGGKDSKIVRAHGYSFFLKHGHWPSPQCLHNCHNRHCINPEHLYEGTVKQNAHDRIKDDTQQRGETQWKHKLTERDIPEIRAKLSQNITHKEIAKMYNVSKSTISAVATGQNWSWLA